MSSEIEYNTVVIVVYYLKVTAHERRECHSQSHESQLIQILSSLKNALTTRFNTSNKVKIARDKLAKCCQVKDISTLNDDFQRIILDIPNINVKEQIDLYTHRLNP